MGVFHGKWVRDWVPLLYGIVCCSAGFRREQIDENAGEVQGGRELVSEALWDQVWMRWAIAAAQMGEAEGEVPVGAVVVAAGMVVGVGFNAPIGCCDPTCHAEVMALRMAAKRLGNYRLPEAILYVTVEPCPMCAGAAAVARLRAVVFGANEPKSGAAGSVVDLFSQQALFPHTTVRGGVLAEESARLLRCFFQTRRAKKREEKR
ncbi:MAG: tRNA adenosine(34) deaminase TadA [Hydrogenophilus sp.]|nr:tRNA adenosine(34) deaminase TadA [Hydrogenophilus sp.]